MNNEKPYLEKIKTERAFNPNYGNDRICECGHTYLRHFDWMDNDFPCGCKYCDCYTFVEETTERSKMDDTPIYTITTIRHALEAGNRAVGYAHKFEDADRWVRENIMSLNECGYYPFAVIEPVVQGIYCHPREEHWYKFNNEKDRYEPCEKPDRFKQVIGWSLG